MTPAKMIARAMKQARDELEQELKQDNESFDDDDVAERAAELLDEWACEAAEDREMHGEPEDTPCIQSADLWGTGEGQYHGLIG
jgi:hypothetical protein